LSEDGRGERNSRGHDRSEKQSSHHVLPLRGC
jgi:hypothetical protein